MSEQPEQPDPELSVAVRRATMRLAEAGVASAPVDALLLAAHLLREDRPRCARLMVLRGTPAPAGYDDLVEERATRVPLQHLTVAPASGGCGSPSAPASSPPRPRPSSSSSRPSPPSEGRPADADPPVVVDLATGSGAIALAVKDEAPYAAVHAVEVSDLAHGWAVANRDRLGLDVEVASATPARRTTTCAAPSTS